MEANSIVQYLGRIWGSGDVRSGGQTVARASYDFDGVTAPRGGVEGSGDLVLAPSDLKAVFGRVGVQLLSKRVDRPYRSRKSGEWLKTKCLRTGDFVIVGYQPDDRCRIANLKLGLEEADELRYAGVVGTGWTESIALVLKKRLDAIVVPEAPVAGIKAKGTVSTAPTLRAEIAYRCLTATGELRAASTVPSTNFCFALIAVNGCGVTNGKRWSR